MALPESLFEYLLRGIPAIVIATIGGLVQVTTSAGRDEITLYALMVGGLTALFTGSIVFLFLEEFDMAITTQGAITGLAGYGSGKILPAMIKTVCEVINKSASSITGNTKDKD